MSLLWPETIHIGLFPGHCWLQRGRKAAQQSFQAPAFPESGALLRTLEKMLDEQLVPLRKGSKLAIVVSDSLASIATLPWQEALHRPAEIDRYAQICFETLGIVLGDNWVMHSEFRQYAGAGLAYAMPLGWMEALLALIRTRRLRLTTVLPVSAAAYYRQRLGKTNEHTLLLLQEINRISAMIYGENGLLGYDVQPMTGSVEQTRMRLLSRVASVYMSIAGVTYWSTEQLDMGPPANFILSGLPDSALRCLKRDAWN